MADADPDLERRVRQALAGVTDPCCKDLGLSVIDMGLLEGVERRGDTIELQVVLTTGWCPFTAYFFEDMKEAVLRAVPEARDVEIKVDWQTAWTPERLSERAAAELVFLPAPHEVRANAGASPLRPAR
ncbi:MAG TPA: iron-sulfur cluster assembly protein [Bacillota bacterium]